MIGTHLIVRAGVFFGSSAWTSGVLFLNSLILRQVFQEFLVVLGLDHALQDGFSSH